MKKQQRLYQSQSHHQFRHIPNRESGYLNINHFFHRSDQPKKYMEIRRLCLEIDQNQKHSPHDARKEHRQKKFGQFSKIINKKYIDHSREKQCQVLLQKYSYKGLKNVILSPKQKKVSIRQELKDQKVFLNEVVKKQTPNKQKAKPTPVYFDQKSTLQITFSAQSTEPDFSNSQSRISSFPSENYFSNRLNAKNEVARTQNKQEMILNRQKQISSKQKSYRELIRLSSRQKNSLSKSKLRAQMSQILDDIYKLRKQSSK